MTAEISMPSPTSSTPTQRFAREWWREFVGFAPDPGAIRGAIRVAIAVSTPLTVLALLGHTDWIAYGVFGSLTAVYGKRFGYRDRLHAGVGVGGLLLVAVLGGVGAGVVLAGSWPSVIVMTAMSALGFLVSRWRGWLPVPSLFLVFAAGTIGSVPHVPADFLIAAPVAVVASMFGVLLGQAGRLLPTRIRSAHEGAPHTVPLPALAHAPGLRLQLLLYIAGPGAAGLLALGLDVGHPYWAAVSATVPLVGVTTAAQVARGSLRFVGTLIGVGVAFLLLSAAPPLWVLLLATAVFQTLTELLVARNYGLAVICITPLALIMSHLGSSIPVAELTRDRLIETVIGVGVAIAIIIIGRAFRTPD